jgi:steroid 5-alpha reductase family enzyme
MITLLGLGAAIVCGLMFVLWLIHLPMRNAAIVDAGWAGGLAILGIFYAVSSGTPWPHRALIGVMAGVWGIRLGLYLLLTRVIGHPEEGRYQELRRKWVTNLPFKFLLFFESQAILDVILSVPFLLAVQNTSPELSPLEFAGAAIWFIAVIGEIASDAQLSSFKRNPANRGRTCNVGLWRYSRHPNYFFEWLVWMAFATVALAAPYGYLGLISPALILYFLLRVTGIPATEAQSLRSRGDEYRRYQQTTSAFVPWFPKEVR